MSNTKRVILKNLGLFLGFVVLMASLHFSGITGLMDKAWIDIHVRGSGAYGPPIFLIVTALLTALGMPRLFMSFLGGYAFGASLGTLWAIIGSLAGCSLTFGYARLGTSTLRNSKSGRYASIAQFLARSPFSTTLMLRTIPFGHNTATSLVAGWAGIPFFPFLTGSALGYLPQSFIFALLGSGVQVAPLVKTVASTLMLLVSTTIGLWIYRRFKIPAIQASEDCSSPLDRAPR